MRSCAETSPMTAKPPSSPATPEKKILIRVETWTSDSTDATGIYEWYAIDNVDSEEEEEVEGGKVEVETLHPVFQSPTESPSYLSGFASWNSLLYIFGGCSVVDFKPVPNVYYIDTRCPKDGWKPAPNLIHARDSPYGLIFKGRIYALGGSPQLPDIYGESLLPLSNNQPLSNNNNQSWLPLHMRRKNKFSAPAIIDGHAIYGKKLFVYGSYAPGLRSYDFNSKKWTLIEEDFGQWQNQCASIDEVMYLVEGGNFMAFDLVKHQWYTVVGLKEDSMLPPFSHKQSGCGLPSSLVHIGNGTLCLLWNSIFSVDYSAIHCTKFTVCKEEDTNGCSIIKATVKSFKIFRLLNGGYLAGSLAIDSGEESDHSKVEHEEEEESVKDQGNCVIIAKKEEEEYVKDQGKSVIIAKKEEEEEEVS